MIYAHVRRSFLFQYISWLLIIFYTMKGRKRLIKMKNKGKKKRHGNQRHLVNMNKKVWRTKLAKEKEYQIHKNFRNEKKSNKRNQKNPPAAFYALFL